MPSVLGTFFEISRCPFVKRSVFYMPCQYLVNISSILDKVRQYLSNICQSLSHSQSVTHFLAHSSLYAALYAETGSRAGINLIVYYNSYTGMTGSIWRGDRLGWGHMRILYKAPTDYTKPRKTIPSPDRLYKAPKRLDKDTRYQTKPKKC